MRPRCCVSRGRLSSDEAFSRNVHVIVVYLCARGFTWKLLDSVQNFSVCGCLSQSVRFEHFLGFTSHRETLFPIKIRSSRLRTVRYRLTEALTYPNCHLFLPMLRRRTKRKVSPQMPLLHFPLMKGHLERLPAASLHVLLSGVKMLESLYLYEPLADEVIKYFKPERSLLEEEERLKVLHGD